MPFQITKTMVLIQQLLDSVLYLQKQFEILPLYNRVFLIPGVNEGFDYGNLENARKLVKAMNINVHTTRVYIFKSTFQNDEVLAVAYQYTVGDQVYQVGEFANDGLNATDSMLDPITGNQIVTNKSLVLKMLKSAVTNVNLPIGI